MRDEIEKIRAHISELESERDWLRERALVMAWAERNLAARLWPVSG